MSIVQLSGHEKRAIMLPSTIVVKNIVGFHTFSSNFNGGRMLLRPKAKDKIKTLKPQNKNHFRYFMIISNGLFFN